MASDRNALKAQARTFLRGINRIGKVASRVGEKPTWDERRLNSALAFWEVRAFPVTRARTAAGRNYVRRTTLQIEGWLPLSAEQSIGYSEERWTALVDAVMDELAENFDVVGALMEAPDDLQPQLAVDDEESKAGEHYTAECHHVVITLVVPQDDTLS